MKLFIHHATRYDYSASVSFGDQLLFLRPRDTHLLRVVEFGVRTDPPSRQRWVRDVFNNVVLVANFGLQEARALTFDCRMRVQNEEQNPFDFVMDMDALYYPFEYSAADRFALQPAIDAQVAESDTVAAWLGAELPMSADRTETVAYLSALNQLVCNRIGYIRRDDEGVQSPDDTLRKRSGSCRDMALLFIAAVRHLGMAARFVSGYLYDPPEDADGFNRAVGSMHAWAEVYLPGAGWKGFDPTNGILANGFFVPCAVSLFPDTVNPIQGRFFSNTSAKARMSVELNMELWQ